MLLNTIQLSFKGFFQGFQKINESAASIGIPLPIMLTAVILFLWGRQALKWNTAEKYYVDILRNIGLWKQSLQERLNYYQEPGSSYIMYM